MTDLPQPLPKFAELPIRAGLPPRSAWEVWGEHDTIGAMNLLTPQRVLDAKQLIRRGAVIPLNWPLVQPEPPLLGRGRLEHTIIDGPSGPDDRYDAFYPQASSQWDALQHVRHPQYGYWNGRSGPEVGIQAWAERGLAGRFVLIDVAKHFAERGTPIDPGVQTSVGVAELEAILQAQGVALSPGTFLLFNFGWTDWYLDVDDATKARLAQGADFSTVDHDLEYFFPAPGIARTEEMAAWLWDSGVVAVAADCPGVESMPMERSGEDGFLHYRIVPLLGIGIGELWDLRALVADCAADGVYEGFLTSAPLNMPGGAGSPANALAIK